MATFIAGPGATTILSDFGADVIKIEVPGKGDPYRLTGFFRRILGPRRTTCGNWRIAINEV
jgi:crotonobetainyl-CoA:carnitine CoA-transferase CaiB-like acyl-CoA transferase